MNDRCRRLPIKPVNHAYLATDSELQDFCRELENAPAIAFDTEFISEDSYRPELCLIQVALERSLVVIDPLSIDDLQPFWDRIVAPGHQTVVHAAREEFLFCRHACGTRPADLFDIQIAAGFLGLEYPAAYGTLVSKVLGKHVHKGETRTNWRRRPLSKHQIDYALQDVLYLLPLRDALVQELDGLGRREWVREEMENWQTQLESQETGERWRRVSGLSGLNPRAMAVAREVWIWRDSEARRRNIPPKRILRDDLLVEIARRQTPELSHVGAIRGMERGDLQRRLPEIAAAVSRALNLPESECPRAMRTPATRHSDLLAQFLNVALSSICRRNRLSPSLVGSVQEVKDLLAYRTASSAPTSLTPKAAGSSPTPPALSRGWRAVIVGNTLEGLLAGETTLRVAYPDAENPLIVEPKATTIE